MGEGKRREKYNEVRREIVGELREALDSSREADT